MKHSPGFLKISEEARREIKEVDAATVLAWLREPKAFYFVDVREDNEWEAGHLPRAEHLSKGIIERDIEARIPDKGAPIVLYCGGGYRSALAAQSLQKMGYTQVLSMAGGYRGWLEKGLPNEV